LGYELDNKGTRVQILGEAGIMSLLHIVCTGRLDLGESVRDLKLTAYLHLVPKLRMAELYLPSPYVLMVWYLIKLRALLLLP
jgi:hypothetical protein